MEDKIDYDRELFVPDHIRTFSGIYFNAFNPNPDLIRIEDIAHALANQPRYAGHLPRFYSVAQHCLYVARLAPTALKLPALLHDAAEAYLLDIPSPFKAHMPDYRAAENNLLGAILKKFNCFNAYMKYKADIKVMDTEALKDEWNFLVMGRPCMKPMFPAKASMQTTPPELIEKLFLAKFACYYKP